MPAPTQQYLSFAPKVALKKVKKKKEGN